MLILTRRPGESILLDGGIRITVMQVESGAVRIGIEAPAGIAIFREELLERMASENRRANATPEELLAFLRDAGEASSLRGAGAADDDATSDDGRPKDEGG